MQKTAVEIIKKHEGKRLKLYECPAGKLTIGYGHNIEDNGISNAVAELMLQEDIEAAERDARLAFDFFGALSPVRQSVVIMMLFNLGLPRLLGFKKMIMALAQGDHEKASIEMLDSKWARQVGYRAAELSAMMNFDTFEV